MKVVFLEVESDKKIYRDYNGGYGTSFNAGRSFLGKLLTGLRTSKENFPYMPYAYGATVMKNNGHDVSIVKKNISELFFENLQNVDLVMMHGSMPNHSHEIRYLSHLKDNGIKVGMIGPFPAMKPELFKDAEFIIKGDVENVLGGIKYEGDIPKGLVSSSVSNLDELPYPDWSLFEIEKFSYSPIIAKKPFTFVLSSRGCTYGCNYCPYISESNLGSKYRMRSVDNVIGELKYLKERFGVKGVQFRDPLFTLLKKRTEDLCNEIIKNNIDIEFGCETRLDRVDEGLLDLMYLAGFKSLKVGIESADIEVLKKSKRMPIALEYQEKMIKHCDKIGMKVVGFYVIGLENDTEETVKATLEYSKKLNTDFANFTICTPIPGTEFYETVKEKIKTDNYDLFDNFHVTFDHSELSEEMIMDYQEKALVGYYLRPRYIYKYFTKTIFA